MSDRKSPMGIHIVGNSNLYFPICHLHAGRACWGPCKGIIGGRIEVVISVVYADATCCVFCEFSNCWHLEIFVVFLFFSVRPYLQTISNNASFLSHLPMLRFTFESLRPNIGLYWYLNTEMFDFFRSLFTSFLQLHALFYPIPVYLKFRYDTAHWDRVDLIILPAYFVGKSRHDSIFMGFLLIAIRGLLHPLPTVSDAGLYMSLVPLFPEIASGNVFLFTFPCTILILSNGS